MLDRPLTAPGDLEVLQVLADGALGVHGDGGATRALAGLHGGELVLRLLLGDGAELARADLAALAPLDGVRRESRRSFDARA